MLRCHIESPGGAGIGREPPFSDGGGGIAVGGEDDFRDGKNYKSFEECIRDIQPGSGIDPNTISGMGFGG
jgi:hypothetical protein